MKWASQGQRLRQLRDAAGLQSSFDVGQAIGRRPQSISQYETGQVRPPLEIALALGELYGAADEVLTMYGYLPGQPDLVARVEVLEASQAELAGEVARLAELVGSLAAQTVTPARRRR
jgi:DNA-binding XRE family transcriptional regulator